jgi:hypothetical protein
LIGRFSIPEFINVRIDLLFLFVTCPPAATGHTTR